ncbi:RHS repeat-associated core domain-containing protein [Myxococcus fulvus]|uniref:RHS repeat-associated core domain-containing protein n=1 Tax=Myxococcus fulvus TaxID=33 RepID=UPI003B9AC128
MQGRVAVGHPVDVASGALFNTWMDLSLPGRVPLMVERYYSTALLGGAVGPALLGPGWRLGFQMALRQTLEGFVYVNNEGAELALEDATNTFEKTGRLIAPASGLELRRQADDSLLLIRYGNEPHPLQLVFEKQSKGVHYVLRELRGTEQSRVELSYNALAQPIRLVQTRTNKALRLRYGARGLLESIALEGESGPARVAYEYDGQGRLWRVKDRQGVLAVYEYDAQARMVSESKFTGAVFRFAYDGAGRCIHATGTDHYEERWLEYQPGRRITRVRDSHGEVTVYEYNVAGQVTSVRSPLGALTAYEFDDAGRLVAETDANKVRAEREYDALGRYCAAHFPGGKQVRLQHDDEHRPVALIDPLGQVWRYTYDAQNNLTGILEPTGLTWRLEFNPQGECVEVTNPLGHVFRLERDRLGRPVRRIDWEGHVWSTEFDADGWVLAEVDPLGQRTEFQRDAASRVTSIIPPDGRAWHFEYDAGGRVVRYQAPDGGVSRLRTSSCGHLLESVDARGGVTTYRWDSEPNRLLEIRNPLGETYRREFDADGRPVSETFWDGRSVRYERDGLGNCTAIVSSSGARTGYAYDEWCNVLRRVAPDGVETKYAYDANQLLTGVESAVKVAFERDVYGNILGESLDGQRITNTYDAMNRRTEMTPPSGAPIRYAWSRNGDCIAIQRGSAVVEFVRDALGREVRRVLPGGGVLETRYDAMSRLLEQAYHPPGWVDRGLEWPPQPGEADEVVAFKRRYHHDAFGHLSRTEDSLRGQSLFKHDATGRLTQVLRPGGASEAYEYDAAGNRMAHALLSREQPDVPERAVTRLAYEKGSRLASVQSARRSESHAYDDEGRLVARHVREEEGPEQVWRYGWTGSGELATVVRPDGEAWTYVYDGMGRRISRRGPRGEHRYLWDGEVILQEEDPRGEVRQWLFEPNNHRAVLQADAGLHFVLPDGVGGASEVVTPEGRLEWVSRQGTWSEPGPEAEGFPLRFPGQWYDSETGWHYNRYRYYAPETGRYISPDPIGLVGGHNLYSYVPSPLEAIDPSGLSARYPSGGPFQHDGGRNYSGVGRTNHATTGNQDAFTTPGGKCMAVVTHNGNSQAFVSGVPDGAVNGSHPRTSGNDFSGPASVHPAVREATSGGMNGNWTHAEMHAMSHILHNPGAYQGGPVVLHIDRPPCRHGQSGRGSCDHALHGLVHQARANGVDLQVTYRDSKGRVRTYC